MLSVKTFDGSFKKLIKLSLRYNSQKLHTRY